MVSWRKWGVAPPVQSRVSHVVPPCEPACCARPRAPGRGDLPAAPPQPELLRTMRSLEADRPRGAPLPSRGLRGRVPPPNRLIGKFATQPPCL